MGNKWVKVKYPKEGIYGSILFIAMAFVFIIVLSHYWGLKVRPDAPSLAVSMFILAYGVCILYLSVFIFFPIYWIATFPHYICVHNDVLYVRNRLKRIKKIHKWEVEEMDTYTSPMSKEKYYNLHYLVNLKDKILALDMKSGRRVWDWYNAELPAPIEHSVL